MSEPSTVPPTSAQRDENRLTATDRTAITNVLAEVMGTWPRSYAPTVGADAPTLERLAHHAIGCSAYDLRDSELAEIAETVRAAIVRRAEDSR